MKCRLCDRPTAAGTGKLCLDCTKALHARARRSAAMRKPPTSPPDQVEAVAAIDAPPSPRPTSVAGARSATARRLGGRPASSRSESSTSVSANRSLGRTERDVVDRVAVGVGGTLRGRTRGGLAPRSRRALVDGARRMPRNPVDALGGMPGRGRCARSAMLRRRRPERGPDEVEDARTPDAKRVARPAACARRTASRAAGTGSVAAAGAGERRASGLADGRRAGPLRARMEKCGNEGLLSRSSANRRRTCSTAKTSGTRIPAA